MRFWGWLALTFFALSALGIGSYFLLTEPVPEGDVGYDCLPGESCAVSDAAPSTDLGGIGALLGGVGAMLGGLMSVYKGIRGGRE